MPHAKVYEIFDAVTDKFLAAGTANELEEKLGLGCHMIHAIGRGAQASAKYKIIQVSKDDDQKMGTASNVDAAKRWDAFCEPIRRRYGIPVRRMTKGDGK